MKKFLASFAVVLLAVAVLGGLNACKKAVEDPVPTATKFVVFDNFTDGDNQTDTGAFGGYWYTFDDLAASNDNIVCGASNVWPMSENANIKYDYGATPKFTMSEYATTGQTKPSGVTSNYYARVSGTVARNGYPYGFAGFGANLLEVDSGTGAKVPVDATAAKYARLVFWYKNGPSVTTNTPWKVKLGTQASLGACKMEEVDNQPVAKFTSTNTWQKFDKAFSEFAPEGWGSTTCGIRAAQTTCVTGAVSYVAGGAQYQCTAAQAMASLDALQWQTNFDGSLASNPFDLMIAEVTIIKGE
ncbi:MAG TPA: hypothetical protein P5511_05355 [Candidatus Goldiibacteriota bacterium]|nr:hypothetical protein [Candidatus Goldiibacteriota bacterium]